MKFYKILKAFGKHAEDDKVEFDDADPSVAILLKEKYIAPAPEATDDLTKDVLGQLSGAVDNHIKAVTARLETATKAVSQGGPRIDVTQDEQDKTPKSFRDFIYNLGVSADSKASQEMRHDAYERITKVYGSKFTNWSKETQQKTALADGTGVVGGYTTRPEYSGDLLKFAIEDSVLANRARIIPMSGPEIHFPALDQTTATGTAGQTSYTGGMVAYWTGEAALRQETEPKFKSVVLKANELSGYTLASRNLLYDNIVGLEAMLQELIRDTASWYIDYGIIQGNGVGMPLGVVNAPATVTVTRATSSKFVLADAATMMGKLFAKARRKAVWLMGPDLFQQLVQLVDASGRVVFLPNMALNPDRGSAQVAPDDNMILFGRPVFFSEKLPALGSTGDVMLVDPSMILMGVRQELEIAASEHYKFANNQMTWRFVARLDAQPWMDKPLTLQDQTRTLSPYVVLHS